MKNLSECSYFEWQRLPMKKKNVLVYPAGTEIGMEIARSLQFSCHFNAIGGNSIRDHSDILYPILISDFPRISEKYTLLEKIKKIVTEYNIDIIIPAHDEILDFFSSIKLDDTIIIAPTEAASKILRYKSETYKVLAGYDFLPKIFEKNEKASLPLFARPDRGQGSVGTFRIDTYKQLHDCWTTEIPYVITEFLPGAEYTIDCYTDYNGNVLYLCPRKRERIRNGICVRVTECPPEDFKSIAEIISARIPIRGAWFFQMKRDKNGELKLMEVANRVAGTMGYERLKGVNLVQANLWEAMGHKVSFPQLRNFDFIYDRALYEGIKFPYKLNTLYVDLDGTIILENNIVNYELIGYIIGLRINLRTKIVLITRHKHSPQKTLSVFGLEKHFDEIIHLQNGERKTDYITDETSIFIDDSFSERNTVNSKYPHILCVGPEGQRILSGFLNL